MDNQPVILEKQFNVSPANLWRALTDKHEMKSWYFDLAEFKAEIGFKFRFNGGPSPDGQFVHLCEVTEVIPEKKLTYTWRYEGYPGNSYVTFELFEQGKLTVLRLAHAGLDTFPAIKDFARTSFEEGWNYIINTSLKNYLELNRLT